MAARLKSSSPIVRAVFVTALLLVAACTSQPTGEPDEATLSTLNESDATPAISSGGESVQDPPSGYMPTYEVGDCPFREPPGTSPVCGYMTVPEDRTNSDGRKVSIAVAVFPASSGSVTRPPVVYLEGGPGGEILEVISFAYDALFLALNVESDLVVFDQRGTGFSEPSLACPEFTDALWDLLDGDPSADESVRTQRAAVDSCREGWLDDGVDLSQYNSADSASDVADLRVALGIEEWDLYGVSYGTRLALTIMRDHPDGIRSAILDSTYPPEIDGVSNIPASADRAFQQLFAACVADLLCTQEFGDLEALLYSVVDQLNDDPAAITVSSFLTGASAESTFRGDDMIGLVFESLYDTELTMDIPQMLSDARQGEYSSAERLISLSIATFEYLAIGQNFSVSCHEEVPFADPNGPAAAAAAHPDLSIIVEGAFTQSDYAFDFCSDWGAGVGDQIEAFPVTSDIPTLVVGGSLDPITPPDDGRAVAERLENGTFVEFPGLGHGVALAEGCPMSITLEFLADPNVEVDTSCVRDMPPLRFRVFDLSGAIPLKESEIVIGETWLVQAPSEWTYLGFGAFARSHSAADITSLVVQPVDIGNLGDTLLQAFEAQLGTGEPFDHDSDIEAGGRTWEVYSTRALGSDVTLAFYEDDIETIMLALITDSRETAHLIDAVMIPAMDTIRRP